MKKIVIIALVFSFGFTSCGPRRYKCGAYRRCEVKPEKPVEKEAIPTEKTTYTVNS